MKEYLIEYATTLESLSGLPSSYTICMLEKKTDYLHYKNRYELYYEFTRMLNKCSNPYIKVNFDKYITRLICKKLGLDVKDITNERLVERFFILRGIKDTIVEYLAKPDIILKELENITFGDTNALTYLDILNSKEVPKEKKERLTTIYLKRVDNYYKQERDTTELSAYLNNLARTYIRVILKEYQPYLSAEAIDKLSIPYTNGIVIVNSYANLIIDRLKSKRKVDNLCMPLISDNDTVYIYLPKLENKSLLEKEEIYSGILLHELLHLVISPKEVKNDSVNEVVTEGLIDMLTRDINRRFSINPKYTSSHIPFVLYVRGALRNTENKERLIFNGSVKDITSLSSRDSLTTALMKQTDHDLMVTDMVNGFADGDAMKKNIYELLANNDMDNISLKK